MAETGIEAPLVLTSGIAASLDGARSETGNVRAFVSKPYNEEALVAQFRALLKSKSA